ncbi:MAG TPA: hypothetical protein VKA34_20875 [Balneolales bacterium]|nr:hypothetical protein [Balneolales bacterium]
MNDIEVAVINKSSVVTDEVVQGVVPALQTQVNRDFAPIWGTGANLKFVAQNSKPSKGAWWLVILDNSDQAGALGYHDMTTEGLPMSKVFAKTIQKYKEHWSVAASHELLEMLADPNINLTVFEEFKNGGRLYAHEVCDACQSENFDYKIDNVLLSDFVYPAWFESFRKSDSAQFDYQNKITKPFQLLKGGYIGVYDVNSGSGWKQITADEHDFRARPPVGSRRERRTIPISERIPSTAFS